MKLLLINPPRYNEIIGNNPEIIEEKRGHNPPLGLLYVAAFIEKYSNHNVTVLDAQVDELSYSDLADKIKIENPDIVGITIMTFTVLDVIKTSEIVKKICPNATIVLGGPHTHLFPNETINLPNIDFLVLGEGEYIFKDLVDAIELKKDFHNIPGIVFIENEKIVNTGTKKQLQKLDDIPFPARHLVPVEKYNSLLTSGKTTTTIFTSRGCPFKCSFCDRPHLGKVFRARSPKNVVDEIQQCVDMNIYNFLIYDDTFTVDKKRVINICNEILKRKLNIEFDIRSRVDTIDEEMVIMLKKAGCRGVHYGIEAGTEKILKRLNKNITIDLALKVFEFTKKHNIPILAYFMIGNPGETKTDIIETFRIMKKLNPDYVHLTILTPFPGTQVYFEMLQKMMIKKDVWKEFANKPTGNFIPPHWNELFSRKQLSDLLIKGYRQFYLRPVYILKQISKIRSFKEFIKKLDAGVCVCYMILKKSILKSLFSFFSFFKWVTSKVAIKCTD